VTSRELPPIMPWRQSAFGALASWLRLLSSANHATVALPPGSMQLGSTWTHLQSGQAVPVAPLCLAAPSMAAGGRPDNAPANKKVVLGSRASWQGFCWLEHDFLSHALDT